MGSLGRHVAEFSHVPADAMVFVEEVDGFYRAETVQLEKSQRIMVPKTDEAEK